MTTYMQWQSSLTLEDVFSQGDSFSYPMLIGEGYLYLSNLSEGDNRNVLMYKRLRDSEVDAICITPEPFNLRTKINEYGGKPYWLFDNTLYFANQSDQVLYQQIIDLDSGSISSPNPVTPKCADDTNLMYADVIELGDGWLLAVVEQSVNWPTNELNAQNQAPENKHTIQAFRHDEPDSKAIELVSGASFYSNLVVSRDATPDTDTNVSIKVAWVEWEHPAMPWDETQLWVADLCCRSPLPTLINKQRIVFADSELPDSQALGSSSVCQLFFSSNGHLFFSVDFANAARETAENYWNIMCYEFDGAEIRRVTSSLSEFGYPHWQYGDARIVQLDETHLLTFATTAQGDQLYLINQDTFEVSSVEMSSNTSSTLQNLHSDGSGSAVAVQLSANATPSIVEIGLTTNFCLEEPNRLLQKRLVLNNSDISLAEHIAFRTRDNQSAYGYYYPPANKDYRSEGVPPVIVMVHGGPTARAYGYFDVQKQFWTNRGFAIFDVNPRGSTGYGRQYRDALYGQWGEVDIADIIDGIDYLASVDKVDSDSVFIRGKSSGGYAVLRALTEYPERFSAGACYYGIGNLATLAEVTHKFEKFYTDRLIGEEYDSAKAKQQKSLFYTRSPIHCVSQLKAPMIIFQGLEDKIVPPSVAQEVVSALKELNVTHSYIEYADEGHGFRQTANNIDAWSRELSFYQSVLSKQD